MVKQIILLWSACFLISCSNKQGIYVVKNTEDSKMLIYKNYVKNRYILPASFFCNKENIIDFTALEALSFSSNTGFIYDDIFANLKHSTLEDNFKNWLKNQTYMFIRNDSISNNHNLEICCCGYLRNKAYDSFFILIDEACDEINWEVKSIYQVNCVNREICSIIKIAGVFSDRLSYIYDWTVGNKNGFTYNRAGDALDITFSDTVLSEMEKRGEKISLEVYFCKYRINNDGYIVSSSKFTSF